MSLFVGKGYNDAFTANMSNIVEQFKHFPNESINLICSADEICCCCPNLREDKTCNLGDDDVINKDNTALTVLGLDEDKPYEYREIVEKLSTLSETDFYKICGTCRWYKKKICTYTSLMKNIKKII